MGQPNAVGSTVLGIIIGVMSVIMVVSIGQGKARILKEMEGIGTNIFGVYRFNR